MSTQWNPEPSELPPYLYNTDPMEPEDIPLQVALLTMEIASLRQFLMTLVGERQDDG